MMGGGGTAAADAPGAFQRNRITRRVIHDLKRRSSIGIVFYMVIACIVFFANGYFSRHRESALVFLGLIIGICLFRLAHLPISYRSKAPFERLHNGIFMVSVVLTALIWGAMFGRFMLHTDQEYQAKLLMAICSTGLTAGGVVAFVPYLRLSLLFNACMMMPPMVLMLIHRENLPLCALVMLYSVYLALISRRGNAEYWDALENEFLLKQKTEALKRLSRIDGLTGLFNRRHFDDVFVYEWKRSQRNKSPLTILMGDIDHFKDVNDAYGHLGGDAWLRLTADILGSIFKRETDTVARYGGEEFVILMPGVDPNAAGELAEKARRRVAAATLSFEGNKIRTTLSIGVATWTPGPRDDPSRLLAAADAALYQAKQEGRNRIAMADGTG